MGLLDFTGNIQKLKLNRTSYLKIRSSKSLKQISMLTQQILYLYLFSVFRVPKAYMVAMMARVNSARDASISVPRFLFSVGDSALCRKVIGQQSAAAAVFLFSVLGKSKPQHKFYLSSVNIKIFVRCALKVFLQHTMLIQHAALECTLETRSHNSRRGGELQI